MKTSFYTGFLSTLTKKPHVYGRLIHEDGFIAESMFSQSKKHGLTRVSNKLGLLTTAFHNNHKQVGEEVQYHPEGYVLYRKDIDTGKMLYKRGMGDRR